MDTLLKLFFFGIVYTSPVAKLHPSISERMEYTIQFSNIQRSKNHPVLTD